MNNITKDSSYGLNKFIFPIKNEFQRILDENRDNPAWKYAKENKEIFPFIETIKNNSIINFATQDYLDFFQKRAKRKFNEEELKKLSFAFNYSLITHMDQKRKVGGHAFNHQNSITIELAKEGHDVETIIAGFEHDTIEDRVKDIKKGELIRNKSAREFYLNDYLNSRKKYLNEIPKNSQTLKNHINNIKTEFVKKTKKNLTKIKFNKIEDIISKEIEYSKKKVIAKLSKSSKFSYERYDQDLFEFQDYTALSRKGRHVETKRYLRKIGAKNPILKEIVEKTINKIILTNVCRSVSVKIDDRINNINTLNVVPYNLKEVIQDKKGEGNLKYHLLNGLSQVKNYFVNKAKKVTDIKSKNRELNLIEKTIRYISHELEKKHFTSAFLTEPDYTKAWVNYFKEKIKGNRESRPPIYHSISHKAKINEFWKNIILIDRIHTFIKYNEKNNETLVTDLHEFEKIKNRYKELINSTLNNISFDIKHYEYAHISKSDLNYWNDEINSYISQKGLEEITKPNSDNQLDGISVALNSNINKKGINHNYPHLTNIKQRLESERGYQYTALNLLKKVVENYQEGKVIKKLF